MKIELVLIFAAFLYLSNAQKDLGSLLVYGSCPEYHCKGRDCERILERNGCYVCACKIGSRGRGCDKMPVMLRKEILLHGCPNVTHPSEPPSKPQVVQRWYRHINVAKGVDECTTYAYPYCYDIDHNLWNAPALKSQCDYYCYPELDADIIIRPGDEPIVRP